MKRLLLVLVVLAAGYQLAQREDGILGGLGNSSPANPSAPASIQSARVQSPRVESAQQSDALARAFRNQQSNVQVAGTGTVQKILPDDDKGSRHQRFIIRLSSGETLLIAHNIDLAPRIGALREGDAIEFYGEYEWNNKGGVIHWTHHDPAGRHAAGWIRHNGRLYQ